MAVIDGFSPVVKQIAKQIAKLNKVPKSIGYIRLEKSVLWFY